jgi:lysozyme
MTPKARLVAALGAGVVALVVPCVSYYEGTKLRAYADPVGIPTACTGHTGPEVQLGELYTPQACDDLLATDLYKHDADIQRCIRVPLSDGERAAYLSFAFNAGATKFCKSTMNRKLNAGDRAGACAELSKWVYAQGRMLPGLVKRRAAERAMCEASL